eukprot:4355636-Amphidinium_carterae.1
MEVLSEQDWDTLEEAGYPCMRLRQEIRDKNVIPQARPMEVAKTKGKKEESAPADPERDHDTGVRDEAKDGEGLYEEDYRTLRLLEDVKPGIIVDAVMPMSGEEWEKHCRDGHFPKRADYPICQVASGPP